MLIARPTESEARLAFAGLADLLADLPDELFARLPGPQRVGLDAALLRAASARPPERRVVGAGFLTLLRASPANRRSCAQSTTSTGWMLPRRRRSSSRCADSARSPCRASSRCARRSLQRRRSLRSSATSSSSTSSWDRFRSPLFTACSRRSSGSTFPRPTLVRIAQAAGGNPLYAIEIARELNRHGERDFSGRVPVPQDLDALVRARVRALPAEAREALLRAATLARPDTRDDRSCRASHLRRRRGSCAIEVDGRIEFVHPLFASAVYSAASAARLREAHRAVADLARDPEERARHLALAASGPDAGVVQELQAAARHARLRGSPDSAAELTGLALGCFRRTIPHDWSSSSSLRSNSISPATSRPRGRCSRSCARRFSRVTCARERC